MGFVSLDHFCLHAVTSDLFIISLIIVYLFITNYLFFKFAAKFKCLLEKMQLIHQSIQGYSKTQIEEKD